MLALRCESQLKACLRAIGEPLTFGAQPKGASWKVAVAAWMKRETDASNGWLAESLDMGSATRVSQAVGALARQRNSHSATLLARLSEKLST